jgi:hypothetical protein
MPLLLSSFDRCVVRLRTLAVTLGVGTLGWLALANMTQGCINGTTPICTGDAGCGPGIEAGPDTGTDGGSDSATEAGTDAGADSGSSTTDAGTDAGGTPDAVTDAPVG